MFSVLVIRLRSLRLLTVSCIVMRLRMLLLLITFLMASHSFRNRLLVICKNAYLFANMIMTSVSCFFCQAEDGIRYYKVTGVQTCALPICGTIYYINPGYTGFVPGFVAPPVTVPPGTITTVPRTGATIHTGSGTIFIGK